MGNAHHNHTGSVFVGSFCVIPEIHHLLTRRLVVPIPDLWMVGLAVFLGKGTQLVLLERQNLTRQRQLVGLVSATAVYGLLGLQVYISTAVALVVTVSRFWGLCLAGINETASLI